jgi:hypothetical protein
MNLRIALSTALVALCGQQLDAQILSQAPTPRPWSRWSIDIGLHLAEPYGGFNQHIDQAIGLGVGGRYRLPKADHVGLRADFALLTYASENRRVPLSPTVNRVLVDMRTSSNIALFTAGPFLAVPRGPVRPYAFGFGGFSYFYTSTSVGDDGDSDYGGFASTTHMGDFGLAYGWGGGFGIPFRIRRARLALDFGVKQTMNGTRTFMRPSDVQDQPDGSLVLNPRTSDARFWQWHVAVSFDIPRQVVVQR